MPAPALAVVLVGCFVCQMGLGAGYIFGATLKHIVAEFEWSRTAFSAATAPLLLAMALASPVVGTLTERWGPRRILCGATLAVALSLWLFSRMESLWEFYATSALFGAALTGLGDIVVGSVAASWVRANRGLTLAFVYIGSNVGGALVPVLAESVASRSSWRDALVVIAGGVLMLILPFAAFGVRAAPSAPQPESVDVARQPAASTDAPGEPQHLDLAQAIRTRTFWVLAFVLFSFYFYYLAINQHLVAFLSDRGFSDARAAASLSFAVALGVVSKLFIGALADRTPGRGALALNFAVLTLGSFLLLGIGRPGFLLAFLIAHGFATAAENVILPLTVADCFGTRHLAQIYGALMVMLFPGGVLGPVFAGAVFDASGDYGPAFGTFAGLNTLGLLSLAWIRREREEPRSHGAA